jgi:hypothetical protein
MRQIPHKAPTLQLGKERAERVNVELAQQTAVKEFDGDVDRLLVFAGSARGTCVTDRCLHSAHALTVCERIEH